MVSNLKVPYLNHFFNSFLENLPVVPNKEPMEPMEPMESLFKDIYWIYIFYYFAGSTLHNMFGGILIIL